MTSSTSLLLKNMTAEGRFCDIFGISQEVYDRVWRNLTDEQGNAIAYISMEIGADPDVYNPVREKLPYCKDSSSFYMLPPKVLKDFYDGENSAAFLDKGFKNLILNVPIFNTHRMATEYLKRYQLELSPEQTLEKRTYAQLYSSDN